MERRTTERTDPPTFRANGSAHGERFRITEIRVMRSVWESVTSDPKTRKSKAPVPVIVPMQRFLDLFRSGLGNSEAGPIFATMKGTPLSLNNVLNRQILPVLNVCAHCGKRSDEYSKLAQEYERDSKRPVWHGWHAFRRGLTTNLHDLGVADKTIQAILRHANVQVTQNSYMREARFAEHCGDASA